MSNVAKAPVNSKRPYMMRKGIASVNDLVDGQALANVALAGAKTIYYVDGNYGSDSQGGTGGWDNAKQTLAAGLAASHADISSGAEGWAARNVILCKGDALTEDLVLFAQKTDVIGVGSFNADPQCGLTGNHVPASRGTGTRFFNMFFKAAAGGGDIFTLDSSNSNIEFHGCTFYAGSATAATAAIIDTASPFLGLYGNNFVGKFSDAVVEFGTGDGFRGTRIVGNYIEGANQGIHLNSGTTPSAGVSLLNGLIKDNFIHTATECIYDEADIAAIVDNTCITLQAKGSSGAGFIVGEENVSANNWGSSSDAANMRWPATESL